MKKFGLILFTAIAVVFSSSAQDIHFSQFWVAPSVMNPALTGVFDGSFRFIGNYKNQWGSVSTDAPYSTIASSLDFRIDNGFAPYDNIGLGISFFNDRAGDSKLRDFSMNVSGSYMKVLNKYNNMYLTVGVHGGFISRSIDYTALRFGDQYNGEEFDPDIITGEQFAFNKFTVGELGAGIAYYAIPKERMYIYISGGIFHLTSPNISFFDDDPVNLNARWAITIGNQTPLGGSAFDVVPSVMFMRQGPHTEGNVGSMLKYNIDKRTAVGLGVWGRIGSKLAENPWADALIVATRVDFNSLSMGVSYDVNLSDLKRGSATRGGIELSLVYIGESKTKPKTLSCPRF